MMRGVPIIQPSPGLARGSERRPALEIRHLYVHVPFCASRCGYCDFYTTTGSGERVTRDYFRALDTELSRVAEREETPCALRTLYIGGGTPTHVPDRLIRDLIRRVRDRIGLLPESEATIEANPDSLEPGALEKLREWGFNRVSIGVQSLVDGELETIGRTHSSATARRSMARAMSAGFESVSADLIYGIPGQTMESWEETLRTALATSVDHISCYELTLHPGATGFSRLSGLRSARGPCDDEIADMYFLANRVLAEEGDHEHYEVSNYARKAVNGGHRCRHNMACWEREPYLGLGASAHSFDGTRRRWWNVSSVERYTSIITGGLDPVEGRESLDECQISCEIVMLGLRTASGLDYGWLAAGPAGSLVEGWIDGGLLELRDGDSRVVPSAEGMLVADMMARELAGALEPTPTGEMPAASPPDGHGRPEDARASSSLYERIYRIARRIPRGRVATYKQLSCLVGNCTPRVVGYAMAAVREDCGVPWHRVVNGRGRISVRSDGEPSRLQRVLLEGEGIGFDSRGRIDLESYGWRPGESGSPEGEGLRGAD